MNWEKVARYLEDEAFALQQRADTAFVNDNLTQREMRTRAALLIALSEALQVGLR